MCSIKIHEKVRIPSLQHELKAIYLKYVLAILLIVETLFILTNEY